MTRNVAASFPDRQSAERAAADLQTAGFPAAEIGMLSQEPTGPTNVRSRLRPNRRSVTGALLGSLILGTVGFLLGWLFIQIVPDISHGGTAAAAGAWTTAAIGGVIGWLWGALVATRAPVEEGYYRARRQEAGATRLIVDAADREDEAWTILRRSGGQNLGNAIDRSAYRTDTTRGALT